MNIEGQFQGQPTTCELGTNKKGQPELKIAFAITEGEHKGRQIPYSGLFGEKAIRYTKSAMLTLGWQGKDIGTAVADIMKAKKVVPIEVQIARWENPDTGKISEWSTVRNVGRYSEPLKPFDRSTIGDLNADLAKEGSPGSNDVDSPF